METISCMKLQTLAMIVKPHELFAMDGKTFECITSLEDTNYMDCKCVTLLIAYDLSAKRYRTINVTKSGNKLCSLLEKRQTRKA